MTATSRQEIRRNQIREAAIAIIDEQGIQNLSLSEIEKKTGLVRGQLMYYFRSKEDILLSVFDRLLQVMHARAEAGDACPVHGEDGWEKFTSFLQMCVLQPPAIRAFHSLQYTFLSQIGHREDFRQRLANLYSSWRGHMADHFAQDMALITVAPHISPRAFATLVQAILHGLAMQRVADPGAFDSQEMLNLVLELLSPYLNPAPVAPKNKRGAPTTVAATAAQDSQPRGRRSARSRKVNHA
jgi:AcrR family transcriptional regulator